MQNLPDLQHLANMPGVTFKRFCSFCTNEATGDLQVPVDDTDETFPLPVCEVCVREILDKQYEYVLD